MTKISTYNIDDNVTANDKWIGSDVNNFNKTKNFTPKKLAIYFNGSQVINTGMELLYKYFTITPPETRPVGTISFENEIGPVVSFSSITTFLISKYTQKGNEVNEFLGFLVGTKSLLYKADDVNVFGYYDIVSIDPYIDDNNFYVVTLSFIEGNGSIEEDKDYMISMIEINPTEAQDLQNVTDIGSITTNTITAEAFIKNGGTGANVLLDNGNIVALSSIGGNQNLQEVTDLGSTTTNSITANSFIKNGGTPTQFLMGDGSVTIGNGGVYSYEIHVSQVDGNDTTGTGAVLNPVASITKALTLITGQRRTIVIHPGNYTENPSITTRYTVVTTYEVIGGNTLLTGTLTTSTGCSITGLKMTNLTITAPTGTGNVNILNCDISGTLTKSSTADYTLIRFCDIGTTSITGANLVAIFGGNPNFITVNNAAARVIVKTAVTVAPVLTAGSLSLVDSIVIAAVTNAFTSAAGTFTTLANSQFLISALNNVAPVVLNGFYSILNCVFNKPNSTLVALSGTGGSTNSIVYSQFINADKFIKQGGDGTNILLDNGNTLAVSSIDGTVTSVGVSMPSAFTVTNSPVETSGTIEVTGAGLASQYIRGDGQLASFPDIAGGGGGQVYYCNGGTSQGTIGGNAFYQISTGASLATGVDFTSGTANNIAFANFITDVGKPTQEVVPAGVWIFQCYLSASARNDLEVYATVEIYNGSTFNVLATSLVEVLTGGTSIDLYTFTCAVPEYDPLVTADRIAIRFYPSNLSGGRTITLHTQNSHLSSIQTTFTTGLASLNGLTSASQLFATGTSGDDFNVNSTDATHTFNIPNASSASGRRGLLIANDWTTFNSKEPAITVGTTSQYWRGDKSFQTLNTAAVPELTNLYYTDSRARLALSSSATGLTYTNITGVFSLTSGYSIPSTTSQTNWDTAYTSRISTFSVTGNSGAATFSGNTLNIPEYTLSGLGGAGLASANTFTNINTITKNDSDYFATYINNSLGGGGLNIGAGAGISANIAYGITGNSIGIKLYGDSTENGTPLVVYDGSGLVAQISSSGVITASQLKVPGGSTTGFLKANGDIDSRTFSTGGGTATGTNTGDETTARIGVLINGSLAAVPNDADFVATADTSVLKKITWTSVKAFLKTYFDTLYSDRVYNITISGTANIDTNSPGSYNSVSGYGQNGRNVMIQNSATSITITCLSTSTTDFIATYTKLSASGVNVSFAAGTSPSAVTLVTVSGAYQITGNPGSTALLTRTGNTYYLLINNI